jgi:hypothetical protein
VLRARRRLVARDPRPELSFLPFLLLALNASSDRRRYLLSASAKIVSIDAAARLTSLTCMRTVRLNHLDVPERLQPFSTANE